MNRLATWAKNTFTLQTLQNQDLGLFSLFSTVYTLSLFLKTSNTRSGFNTSFRSLHKVAFRTCLTCQSRRVFWWHSRRLLYGSPCGTALKWFNKRQNITNGLQFREQKFCKWLARCEYWFWKVTTIKLIWKHAVYTDVKQSRCCDTKHGLLLNMCIW